MADSQHDHPDDGGVHVHIHSWKLYAGILGALLFLTVLTVAASYLDIDGLLANGREVEGIGAYNLALAIAIATVKASLVLTFFMHLKDDKRFNGLIFLGSLFFVGLFFAYTMNDTYFRGRVGDRYNGVHVDPDTGEIAPGGITRRIPGEQLEPGLPGAAAEAAALRGQEAEAEAEALEDGEVEGDMAADPGAEGEEGAVEDIVEEILGEEDDTLEEDADGAEAGDDDFIDEVLGEEDGAPEADAPTPDEEPEPPAARRAPRPAPTPAAEEAPAADDAAEEAPSQPEPEPEPEAAE